MSVTNAYRLCVGVFKQDSTGSVWTKLTDPDFSGLKWNAESIIPSGYDFTNLQIGDTTIETVEKNTITAMSKARRYDSGALTPPTYTLATVLAADVTTIIEELEQLSADDPYKVLFAAGVYASSTTASDVTTRVYNVFTACGAILTTDGSRSGEAKANFTGSLALQACHIPLIGSACGGATLSWNTSTNKITFAAGSNS